LLIWLLKHVHHSQACIPNSSVWNSNSISNEISSWCQLFECSLWEPNHVHQKEDRCHEVLIFPECFFSVQRLIALARSFIMPVSQLHIDKFD
jgi:hypothetical protein